MRKIKNFISGLIAVILARIIWTGIRLRLWFNPPPGWR